VGLRAGPNTEAKDKSFAFSGDKIPVVYIPAVTQLLTGASMSDRSKVMTQTKRDTLDLKFGGWAWGNNTSL
jgi:hypothetical protein